MGVGEFLQSSREWYDYADEIRRKKVPLKISIVRPKTKIDYWTLIWDDGIDALATLLAGASYGIQVVVSAADIKGST